jgi:hypothetical protein
VNNAFMETTQTNRTGAGKAHKETRKVPIGSLARDLA